MPFYPLNNPKYQDFEKIKKDLGEILSFYTIAPKIMIICYTDPEIWHVTDVIFIFRFRVSLSLLPPNSPKNENFKKLKKTTGDATTYTSVP